MNMHLWLTHNYNIIIWHCSRPCGLVMLLHQSLLLWLEYSVIAFLDEILSSPELPYFTHCYITSCNVIWMVSSIMISDNIFIAETLCWINFH
jgi:hypothetical protein